MIEWQYNIIFKYILLGIWWLNSYLKGMIKIIIKYNISINYLCIIVSIKLTLFLILSVYCIVKFLWHIGD